MILCCPLSICLFHAKANEGRHYGKIKLFLPLFLRRKQNLEETFFITDKRFFLSVTYYSRYFYHRSGVKIVQDHDMLSLLLLLYKIHLHLRFSSLDRCERVSLLEMFKREITHAELYLLIYSFTFLRRRKLELILTLLKDHEMPENNI